MDFHDQTPRCRPLAQRWEWLAVAGALSALAFCTHLPYHRPAFHHDDQHHLRFASMCFDGELNLVTHLLTPHNEHWLPLWKLWYVAQWRCFGAGPTAWWWPLIGAHALGAIALYIIGRRWLGGQAAGLAAGSLWSASAIGHYDNPLLWIGASHLSFGLAAVLISLACLSVMRGTRERRRLAATACFVMGIGMMGVMALLAPLCAGADAAGAECVAERRRVWFWWGVVASALVAAQLAALWWTPPPPVPASSTDFARAWTRATRASGVALVRLAAGGATLPPPSARPWLALAGMVLVGFTAWRAGSVPRAALLASWTAMLGYLVLVASGRGYLSEERWLTFGRYLFPPTLAWCVTAGVLVGSLQRLLDNRMATLLGMALLMAHVHQQCSLATSAVAEMRAINGEQADLSRQYRRVLERLALQRTAEGPLRWPETMTALPEWPLPLSRFVAVAFPHGLAGFRVVPSDQLTLADRLAAEVALANLGEIRECDAARQLAAAWRD